MESTLNFFDKVEEKGSQHMLWNSLDIWQLQP
jgi:hypothetical protein